MKKIMAKKPNGFTLIEFVIVIALASLLMLTVLNATGGAKRSQRDAARKSDFGRMRSQLESYASNHGGKYPRSTEGYRPNTADDASGIQWAVAGGPSEGPDEEFLGGWMQNYAKDIRTPDEYVGSTEEHAPYTFYALGQITPSDCIGACVNADIRGAVGTEGWAAGLPQTTSHRGANRVFYVRGSWNDAINDFVPEPGRYSIWMVMEGGIPGFNQDSQAVNASGVPQ
jgi:prepilin-type N-terminal cleavage/methylation domain-containing protein